MHETYRNVLCSSTTKTRLLVVTHNRIYKVTQSKRKQKNNKLLKMHRDFRLK